MISTIQTSDGGMLLKEIAEAVLSGDTLKARALAQGFLKQHPRLDEVPSPATTRAEVLVVAAALIEMFSQRLGQTSPSWTQAVGGLKQPRYLVHSAQHMKRLRELCEAESPLPLKARGLFAPPDYLSFA